MKNYGLNLALVSCKYEEAIPPAQHAREKALGPDHPSTRGCRRSQ